MREMQVRSDKTKHTSSTGDKTSSDSKFTGEWIPSSRHLSNSTVSPHHHCHWAQPKLPESLTWIILIDTSQSFPDPSIVSTPQEWFLKMQI